MTIVTGESDEFFEGQQTVMNVSGFTCADGSSQCWSPDLSGAGWYRVKNTQVVDAVADHCYQLNGGCSINQFDGGWLNGTSNWTLKPNLDWLATFGTRRTFSANGE